MSLGKLKRSLFYTKLAARRTREAGLQYGNPTWRFIENFFHTVTMHSRSSKRSVCDRRPRIG